MPSGEVLIVGGGFGGLAAAQALRHTSLRVTLLDRRNHHVFQARSQRPSHRARRSQPSQPSKVFVIGDMAAAHSTPDNHPVPGVAQAAMQMGRYVGYVINEDHSASRPRARSPFVYRDKGSMATIGRAKAVATIGRLSFDGLIAWLLWAIVHIVSLIGFRNRLSVIASWLWNWLVFARDARIITGLTTGEVPTPCSRGASSEVKGMRKSLSNISADES